MQRHDKEKEKETQAQVEDLWPPGSSRAPRFAKEELDAVRALLRHPGWRVLCRELDNAALIVALDTMRSHESDAQWLGERRGRYHALLGLKRLPERILDFASEEDDGHE